MNLSPFPTRSLFARLIFRNCAYLMKILIQLLKSHRISERFIFFLILFGISFTAGSTDPLRISLLTCSPGEELYSVFGHSAFRVKDSITGLDKVYNYGTFNFREKNFYLKFMSGKLNYYLSTQTFDDFMADYQAENRAVYEQVFYLSPTQNLELYRRLELNMAPQNRAYKYDFFWDNCSTRIRDMVETILPSAPQYPSTPPFTFRDYLHKYLIPQPWSQFGIDLILGLPADKITISREAMFLPMEMMDVYDQTQSENQRICTVIENILPALPAPYQSGLFHPKWVLLFLLCLTIIFYYFRSSSSWFNIYANIFLLVTGIGGLIIGFLWFIADHTTTDLNLHFIWANPLCLLYPLRNKLFSPRALELLTITYAVLLVFMIFGVLFLPQDLPVECIPVWLSLILIMLSELKRIKENK